VAAEEPGHERVRVPLHELVVTRQDPEQELELLARERLHHVLAVLCEVEEGPTLAFAHALFRGLLQRVAVAGAGNLGLFAETTEDVRREVFEHHAFSPEATRSVVVAAFQDELFNL